MAQVWAQPTTMSESVERYLAAPFRAHDIGHNEVLLRAAGAQPQRLLLGLAQILSACPGLGTRDALIDQACQGLGVGANQRAGVAQGIDQLIQLGLLQTESGLRAAFTAAPSPATAMAQLFVRSCDRPQDLHQLLSSVEAQHARGRPVPPITVVDDSREDTHRQANQVRAQACGQRLGQVVRCIDRPQRHALVQAIAMRSGADPEALQWLVNGDPASTEASYGSTLNLALLLGAGHGMAVMDDDAELLPFAWPGKASHGMPADVRVVDSQALVTDPLQPGQMEHEQALALDLDPLAAHASLLGANLAAALATQSTSALNLDALTPALSHALMQQPNIRLTSNGTLGDAGVSRLTGLLADPDSQLGRLSQWGASGRDGLLSRRCARHTPALQVAPHWRLMTTTFTGIDNRSLLLPTMVHGRNEDLLFGAWLQCLHPDSLIATLPWMLPHRRQSARSWTADQLSEVPQPTVAGLLAELLDEDRPTSCGHPQHRAQWAAGWLSDLAHQKPEALSERCRSQQLAQQAALIEGLRRNRDLWDAPAWLAADMERAIQALLSAPPPAPIEALQPYCQRLAETLPAWVSAWQWCQHHPLPELDHG